MNDSYYLWVEDVEEKTGCDPTSVLPLASWAGGAMAPAHYIQTWHLLERMPTGVSFINTIRTVVLEQKTAVEGSGSYETSPALYLRAQAWCEGKAGPAGCRPLRLAMAIPASQGVCVCCFPLQPLPEPCWGCQLGFPGHCLAVGPPASSHPTTGPRGKQEASQLLLRWGQRACTPVCACVWQRMRFPAHQADPRGEGRLCGAR